MKIALTQFAVDRHFDSEMPGTYIPNNSPEEFERRVNEYAGLDIHDIDPEECCWRDGYAPFCKLLFLKNWTDAFTGTMPITKANERFLKSEYRSRKSDELPVLVRWFEGLPDVRRARYLCLVLYTREQLAKEGTYLRMVGEVDYGIVAILGQLHNQEEPMIPMTILRNALGFKEGGSGVPLDHEVYMRSVDYWSRNAVVKVLS
jgi:hypothetical protein